VFVAVQRFLLPVLVLGIAGCPEDGQNLLDATGTPDLGAKDASLDASADAAGMDAAEMDAAEMDAAEIDAAEMDAAEMDASEMDAAEMDAAETDAADAGSCTPGLPCATNPGAPCLTGRTACAGAIESCEDDLAAEDGTTCAVGLCAGGVCLPPSVIVGSVDLTMDIVTPGRACAEAPQFQVLSLSPIDATLTATPASDCLTIGDEVLLINLQGTTSATVNVGRWELLEVLAISGTTVQFATPKIGSYGELDGTDLAIGSGADDQKVVLVRVPRFGALTIAAGAVVTAARWDGLSGGVVALRAASLTIDGTISAEGLGYRNGRWSLDSPDCDDNLPTEAGESITGPGAATTARNAGGSGGLSAISNISFNSNTPMCATAGHAEVGLPGLNPNGRVIGEPGAAYGAGDGSRLTMGSGAGGNLTCNGGIVVPEYFDIAQDAGGIVLLLTGDLTIATSGAISATGVAAGRDIAASGGTVYLRARNATLGDNRITALGAVAMGGSPSTFGLTIPASPGYVVLSATGTVTGTTAPPFAP
jgi:hypothetical protein